MQSEGGEAGMAYGAEWGGTGRVKPARTSHIRREVWSGATKLCPNTQRNIRV